LVQFGSLLFKLTAPAQYLGKKNLLAFEFTHMQLMLFGRTVYSGNFRGSKVTATDFYHQPIAKLPLFAFFLVNHHYTYTESIRLMPVYLLVVNP
jgi:hypothetical protein